MEIMLVHAEIYDALTFYCSNVDEVVRFSGQPQRKQLTYATKQLIGREVTCFKLLMLLFDDNYLVRLKWRKLEGLKHQCINLTLKPLPGESTCILYYIPLFTLGSQYTRQVSFSPVGHTSNIIVIVNRTVTSKINLTHPSTSKVS